MQKILLQHKLGRRLQRAEALLERLDARTLTREQQRELERNPAWTNTVEGMMFSYPGHLLMLSNLIAVRRVTSIWYIQLAVDSYSHFCQAQLYCQNNARTAIAFLQTSVLPEYSFHHWKIHSVLTSAASQYCGSGHHPFGRFLAESGIAHRSTRQQIPSLCAAQSYVVRSLRSSLSQLMFDKHAIEEARLALATWITRHNRARIRNDIHVAGQRPLDLLQHPPA